jgi:hypothetical protein
VNSRALTSLSNEEKKNVQFQDVTYVSRDVDSEQRKHRVVCAAWLFAGGVVVSRRRNGREGWGCLYGPCEPLVSEGRTTRTAHKFESRNVLPNP